MQNFRLHALMIHRCQWIAVFAFALLAVDGVLGAEPLTLAVGGLKPGAVVTGTNIVLREPDGARGAYKHGFWVINESAADWQKYYGVRFEVKLPGAATLTAGIARAARVTNIVETLVTAEVNLAGGGWQTVTLPWSAFQFEQANNSFLKFVKEFTVSAAGADGRPLKIQVRNARVVAAPVVSLQADICGKSAAPDGGAVYEVTVGNCTDAKQAVTLAMIRHGWEAMTSSVTPEAFDLAPGESRTVTVMVRVPDRVATGGHEEQWLQAIGNGDAAEAAKLRFITTRELPHPYILHTAARWHTVRDNVTKYDWAKEAEAEIVQRAEDWQVPEVAKPPQNDPDDTYGPYLFPTTNENGLMACGEAWQLTGRAEFAKKVAVFLRALSDPKIGYPVTLRACNQSMVQEGHFFQHIAMAYDMISDSGELSAADRQQIERTFRIFIETVNRSNDYGPINNWNVAEVCGAFYCALAMQDLVAADRFFSGPCGICDQLAKGVMDDGWWYECSISYNMWVASEFTQVGLAYQSFGVNFLDMELSSSYSRMAMIVPELNGGALIKMTPEQQGKPFGMSPEIFGPNRKPSRDIRSMWNSLLPFVDWRNIMFGVNDSIENFVGGYRTEVGAQPFELAYYAYRDPAYAAIIKQGGGKRDLLYGVPELPANTPENFRDDAYADNVGLVMLRSQTTNRPVRAQIQATLHYGTHGWAHGHYDRTDLLSLIRYGKSFWSPESVFWVYEPFMYKFYCQCSVNHNMVVVDQKLQEATPGERLLFHHGEAMQATVVQTKARWSNPPYGGMVYDYVPVKTFAEKCWREGRSVPIPSNAPAYGTLTGYTEDILQRRALVVMDDYIVLADYVKGTNTHTFEDLFQLKGFQELEAPGKQLMQHDAQWNPDPVGSAQFVTDCNWYSVSAPAVSRYIERWGPGADNEGSRSTGNEDGVLKLDVHSLWPQQQAIMVGTAPELREVQKRLYYTVRGDGNTLTNGQFGAWILGKADIDVPVTGVKQLELETKTELAKLPTLFWANARIVTQDGKEIPLAQLLPKFVNMNQPKAAGQDYFGGPIKIVGDEYASATPAEPQNENKPAVVRVDLNGVNAMRFKATLGGDYPLGDESQRRKVTAIRAANGSEARFLTVIEPYEDQPVIKSAEALSADKVRVELTDGRVQEIELQHFTGGDGDIAVKMTETKDGQVMRQETTVAGEGAVN